MADAPSAQRALLRAWGLACLVGRGFLEGKDDVKGREVARNDVLAWFRAMGLDEEGARELAARAVMRPEAEIAAYAEQARNVHWRLRRLRAGVAVHDCTRLYEGYDAPGVSPVELVEGDLAFDGTPVGQVARPVIASAVSIATQRQRASSWLEGDAHLYSEVGLDT